MKPLSFGASAWLLADGLRDLVKKINLSPSNMLSVIDTMRFRLLDLGFVNSNRNSYANFKHRKPEGWGCQDNNCF